MSSQALEGASLASDQAYPAHLCGAYNVSGDWPCLLLTTLGAWIGLKARKG